MTKFEKEKLRIDLLEAAYNAVLDIDKQINYNYDYKEFVYTDLIDNRKLEHEYCLEIADMIANLL